MVNIPNWELVITKYAKKIEAAANIAVIVFALTFTAILSRQYLFTASSRGAHESPTNRIAPKIGDLLALDNVDWEKNVKTLLLALSTRCNFCTQSGPFYQRLVKDHGDAHLIVLVPQTVEAGRAYVKKLGVDIDDVRQVSFGGLGVSHTPTLILVDRSGRVVHAWIGALPSGKEDEVVSGLRTEYARR